MEQQLEQPEATKSLREAPPVGGTSCAERGPMKVIIETIEHRTQRYPTVGDWFYQEDTLHIKVSKMSNWRYEALVAIHELVEVLACQHDGITQEVVDEFDINYEKQRTAGDCSEPGDAIDAPYRKQHCLATGIERILAAEWGVNWAKYEDEVDGL